MKIYNKLKKEKPTAKTNLQSKLSGLYTKKYVICNYM